MFCAFPAAPGLIMQARVIHGKVLQDWNELMELMFVPKNTACVLIYVVTYCIHTSVDTSCVQLSDSDVCHQPTFSHTDGSMKELVFSCLIKSFSHANESPYTLHTDLGVRSSILMSHRSVPTNDRTRGNLFVLTGCWSAVLDNLCNIILSPHCWN